MSKSKYKNKSWRRNKRLNRKSNGAINLGMLTRLENMVMRDTILFGEGYVKDEYESIYSTLARFNSKRKEFDLTHTPNFKIEIVKNDLYNELTKPKRLFNEEEIKKLQDECNILFKAVLNEKITEREKFYRELKSKHTV